MAISKTEYMWSNIGGGKIRITKLNASKTVVLDGSSAIKLRNIMDSPNCGHRQQTLALAYQKGMARYSESFEQFAAR